MLQCNAVRPLVKLVDAPRVVFPRARGRAEPGANPDRRPGPEDGGFGRQSRAIKAVHRNR